MTPSATCGTTDRSTAYADTAFATGAASWLADDHFELWIGTDQSGLSCNDPTIKLSQWGIGLDGRINHGSGDRAGAPEFVARAESSVGGRKQVTLHLRLPAIENDYQRAVTVVFSKSEGGKQARLTATSPVKRGDETTLSSVRKLDTKAARCQVRDGQLDLVESGLPAILGEK